MYGSILSSVTCSPRASSSAPSEAAASPLPNEDTTPPLTKMNLVLLSRSTVGPSPASAAKPPCVCARASEVLGCIYLKRRRHGSYHPDPKAALERAQLFELLERFEHTRLKLGKTQQELAAIGVNADMAARRGRRRGAVARPRNRRARKVQRIAASVAHHLHHVWIAPLLGVNDRRRQRGHREILVGAHRRRERVEVGRIDKRQVPLHVDINRGR